MNLDKISDERLFQNNSKEDVIKWCNTLKFFHYMRDRGGHNCEGDSFCVYFKYDGREDLLSKFEQLGITVPKLEEGFISYDPTKSYSFDDLDKLKVTILEYPDLEQPQHLEMFGQKVHVWVLANRFEISVSGSKEGGDTYSVSDEDFVVCQKLEQEFNKLDWQSHLDEEIKKHSHCVSKEKYPELFTQD